MKQMRHPNIVGYRNSFIEDDYINIVMTYCEGGDMYNKIKANGGKHFSENVTLNFSSYSLDCLRVVRPACLQSSLPP